VIELRLGIGFFAALLWTSASWGAEPTQLTFAHNGGGGSLYELSADEFVRRLKETLPANYIVTAYGDSKLGDDTVVLAKVKRGEITFGLPSSVMSSVSETFGIFELPFLIRDRFQVRQISDAMLDSVLQPEAKKHGFRILAIWENGFRQITNNVRPIRRPEDLRGLKLRVPKGLWREKAFRAMGAEPVPMPLHEVYKGLQSGIIEGQENPLSQIYGSKFHEVQQYLTLSDHVYTPAYLIVSNEHFAKLPPEVRRVIERTAEDMQAWIYAVAIRMESDLIDKLGERMQSNQVDVKAFVEASRPLYGEFVRTVPGGAKLVNLVNELADSASASVSAIPAR
jgi:tripartite ATP-independent transporter DctP family solute receptor